ncbi:MAG: histidine kinase N-terminal 7TM domain-containing protein [Candidatus Paceibacterota bacterium]|jgi:hypothetical protein
MEISPSFVLQVLTIFLWSGAALSLFFGGFVWLQNKKSPINILFALVACSVAVWLGASVPMLNNCQTKGDVAYFWDKIVYCGVVFIPIFLFHFSLVMSKEKNKIYLALVPAGYFLAAVFLFLLWFFPQLFIQGLFQYKWGCHSISQPSHNYFLIYFVGYLLLFFYKMFRLWRNTNDPDLKIQSKYIFYSFLFLFASSLAFLPGYQIPVFPIAYIFPVIWMLILSYAITQHNLLNAKVIIVDVLAALVVFAVLVYAVLSKGSSDIVIRFSFLILIFFFAWLAVRGVHREINEKERLEAVVKNRTKELEQSKKVAEDRAAELEKWYNATIGREVRMAELKEEVKKMKEESEKSKK